MSYVLTVKVAGVVQTLGSGSTAAYACRKQTTWAWAFEDADDSDGEGGGRC